MATQPNKWAVQIGIDSNKTTIPVTAANDKIDLTKLYPDSYELPLDVGGNAVGRTEMNTLFSTIAENVYFQQQGGVYEYSASLDYTVGTVVLYQNDIYKCIQDNGVSSTIASPTNTAYWDRFVLVSDLDPLYKLVPTGVILPYGGVTAPANWLICDGSAVSRTSYSNLFAVIGTRYGAGDGSTTFNIPRLNNGSFVRGVSSGSVGTSYSASLPPLTASTNGAHTHTRGTMNITGAFSNEALPGGLTGQAVVNGAFYGVIDSRGHIAQTRIESGNVLYVFDASRTWIGETSLNGAHVHNVTNSAGVAMTGNTVLPQSVGCNYIIKI